MSKIFRVLPLVLIFFNACFVSKHSPEKSDLLVNVAQVAESELPNMLDRIPAGREAMYGFESREEFRDATTAPPIKSLTIENGEVKAIGSFRVPVVVNGEYRALATVENTADGYHVLDYGATALAKEIQSVCASNSDKQLEGILRIYDINADFLVMRKAKKSMLIPLTSSVLYLNSVGIANIPESYTIEEVIGIINSNR